MAEKNIAQSTKQTTAMGAASAICDASGCFDDEARFDNVPAATTLRLLEKTRRRLAQLPAKRLSMASSSSPPERYGRRAAQHAVARP